MIAKIYLHKSLRYFHISKFSFIYEITLNDDIFSYDPLCSIITGAFLTLLILLWVSFKHRQSILSKFR